MKTIYLAIPMLMMLVLGAIDSTCAQVGSSQGVVRVERGNDRIRPASQGLSEKFPGEGFPCGLGRGCQEDIISADPTFIQVSSDSHLPMNLTRVYAESHGLIGEIFVPYEDALVRANVPIFGRAYGKNFKEYRVEYGQGANPTDWTVIATSDRPQSKDATPEDLHFYQSADLTIEGNLATWDTGLKNYVYLPSHPQDHPIDFKGTYTIRLVVTSHDGRIVEDRVTLHVANVIPNAWGGVIKSPDGRVKLTVPEQAITAPFRLVLIQAASAVPEFSSEHGRELVSQAYEVKESREQFMKPARLEVKLSDDLNSSTPLDRLAIYGYDSMTQTWTYLPSYQQPDRRSLFTNVTQLHAFYAIMSSDLVGEGSRLMPVESPNLQAHEVSGAVPSGPYLVQETFEHHIGQWSNRDGDVGATVSLDELATFDGTKALKIVNTVRGGNFAVNVHSSPFDVRAFPIVQFDYRIEPNVKTSFYVKVAGRWYRIGFTDHDTEVKHQRVNIADIGSVPGIVRDDAWHTAQFNLYELLRTKTGHTVVEEMIMADWDVTGYMKLQFGTNHEGATYYIDNFAIGREFSAGFRTQEGTLLVDNFNQKNERNNLRQHVYTFQDSDTGGSGIVRASFSPDDVAGHGHSLAISYNVSSPESHGGYVTTFPNLDLREFHALTFAVKSQETSQELFIGLKDSKGQEPKIPLSLYLSGNLDSEWKQVVIPLTAFSSPFDWGAIQNLSFSFVHGIQSKGTILIDNIQFHKHINALHVDNFEHWDGNNLLGGQHRTFASGVAAVNGMYTRGSPNGLYRLSYGGNIGKINAYASDLLSYAGWATQLGGIDCSRCEYVSFRLRGGQGGERPNIYLDDGNFRWSVDLEDYMAVTTEWQTVSIPLKAFAKHGVDLTHLEEFQVVFEWEPMSSTLYLDDVWFGKSTKSKS